ncbi:MAG TPA: hypothetical protein VF705_14530 [Longimicrobium sp.]|jgi:hypothetical protein
MGKLRLMVDDLAVESFETARPGGKAGTVRGAGAVGLTDADTCWYTCGESCGRSCTCPESQNSCYNETCTCPFTYDPSPIDSNLSCVLACPEC